jgi:glycosyltransferase involved in cell wall biosynthesis
LRFTVYRRYITGTVDQQQRCRPVAVLDLAFEQLPESIDGLAGYRGALVLIRLRNRPAGQALLPVIDGKLGGGSNLRDALLGAANWSFWENWLSNYLECSEEEPLQRPSLSATVAVCTRDRPDDLRRCLDAIMRLPDDGQEILVIDNCPSTDETQRLAAEYSRVRYLREDRPGLNIARNRALREARHDIVAFTDDDAAPDPGWLRALLKNFQDPLVMCVTGLTMPLELQTEAQQTFENFIGFGAGFRRKMLDCATHNPLDAWSAGAGVNMAVHKKILSSVGPFDEALDAGTATLSGGDNEMFSRILARGFQIVYEPEALNWHRHRREWGELRRQFYGYGVGGFAAWTRNLLDGEFGVLMKAMSWPREHIVGIARAALNRPGSTPLDLTLLQLAGCIAGPWAYVYSRWRARSRQRQ